MKIMCQSFIDAFDLFVIFLMCNYLTVITSNPKICEEFTNKTKSHWTVETVEKH